MHLKQFIPGLFRPGILAFYSMRHRSVRRVATPPYLDHTYSTGFTLSGNRGLSFLASCASSKFYIDIFWYFCIALFLIHIIGIYYLRISLLRHHHLLNWHNFIFFIVHRYKFICSLFQKLPLCIILIQRIKKILFSFSFLVAYSKYSA